jgi:hypothetical protein
MHRAIASLLQDQSMLFQRPFWREHNMMESACTVRGSLGYLIYVLWFAESLRTRMRCTRDGMAMRDHIAVAAKQETITSHTNTHLTYSTSTRLSSKLWHTKSSSLSRYCQETNIPTSLYFNCPNQSKHYVIFWINSLITSIRAKVLYFASAQSGRWARYSYRHVQPIHNALSSLHGCADQETERYYTKN